MGESPELVRVPVDGPAEAVFTTRVGGVSRGAHASCNLGWGTGDRRADVSRNRRLVCEAIGLDPDRVSVGTQVHGTAIRAVAGDADPAFDTTLDGWPESDGLTTDDAGRGLVVLAADCLPVLLWRRDIPRVAALHCGWRGIAAGLVAAAGVALGEPPNVAAAIGPGIGACCFEVGGEVREVFARDFGPGTVHGATVDLAAAVVVDAVRAGIPASAIWRLDACTRCDASRWFSYRRDGARTGRQAGIIWPV